ncbi:MAG: DUF2764 family protein [Candidatus Euphemobacter frigidus]|nr:DUF2764 family protein [Candidatus Euphemobacter frigidus]MDP8276250.1 DUF2764 family protein [Candidatus Euphemobacter frigidus]
MSRKYYYFAASLPMLSFGLRPQLSNEDFLSVSSDFLTRGDQEIIKNTMLVPEKRDGMNVSALIQWVRFEDALRNELVKYRAKKLGRDPREFYRGEYIPDPYLAAIINEAAGAENPLLVERRIDLIRWERLDEMELQHYFDLDFLIIYFLKLQILNKWNDIRAEKGRAILDELLKPAKEPKK